MEQRGQFTFYRSYYEALKDLPKKDRSAVYEAICAYALDGIEPDLSGIQKSVFTLVRPTLDSGRKKAIGGKKGKPKSNDNGKIPERYPKDVEKEIEKEIEIEIEIENECYNSHTPQIEYEKIRAMYNSLLPGLPACTKMSENRKKAIRARIASGYTLEDFESLFRKTAGSDFLTGKNNRNWVASFDWLIQDGNMAKVLSGNYDNRAGTNSVPKGASGELGEAELEAIQRVLREG